MQKLLKYSNIHIVGIKGVAMSALAQVLCDSGCKVSGSDVATEFVTQPILDTLPIEWHVGFDHRLPEDTQCVVYTSAHKSIHNPIVQQALAKDIPCLSHAQALGELFNTQKGIAVCGVGGKSTTSSMLAWLMHETNTPASYSVGVGSISGLERTGSWSKDAVCFIAEADEYVTDPAARPITPRFEYLNPAITICTNLSFDHPDVYRDFAHTQVTFKRFFSQIVPRGTLIYNADDMPLTKLAQEADTKLLSFGINQQATLQLLTVNPGAITTFTYRDTRDDSQHTGTLQLPGTHNIQNALAAVLAAELVGISQDRSLKALSSFKTSKRRFEKKGEYNGSVYYDDYAHHPNELKHAIQTFSQLFPDKKKVVIFQPHTFSRTRELFTDFVRVLSTADNLVLLDIFASARESSDDTVSSDTLLEAIETTHPDTTKSRHNVHTLAGLKTFLDTLSPGHSVITLGAGDVYDIYNTLSLK